MARRLIGNVNIDDVWYGPAYPDVAVPAKAAEQIGEHAWADDGEDDEVQDLGLGGDRGMGDELSLTGDSGAPGDLIFPDVGGAEPGDDSGGGDGGDQLPEPPPQHGAGSSTEAWISYATELGVEVPADSKQGDVIAAVRAAGFRVDRD